MSIKIFEFKQKVTKVQNNNEIKLKYLNIRIRIIIYLNSNKIVNEHKNIWV